MAIAESQTLQSPSIVADIILGEEKDIISRREIPVFNPVHAALSHT